MIIFYFIMLCPLLILTLSLTTLPMIRSFTPLLVQRSKTMRPLFFSSIKPLTKTKIVSLFSKHLKDDFHEKSSKKNKNDKINLKSLFPEYKPRGPNQELYFKSLQDPNVDIVIGVGPAGSGKTLFACYVAIQELMKEKIKKIIMTRPLVSVDKEDIGYLPGNLVSKMDPWTRPIFDILQEFFSQREIDCMIQSGIIEISPLAYMRGRTFKNAFIIADEMQNSSPNQMLMMTTRIGSGTRMVITGDLKQSDRKDENGLLDFITKIKRTTTSETETHKIQLVELESEDIERSPVVKKIIEMYEPTYIPRPIKRPQAPSNDCAMIPSNDYF